jgi:hypothetical protein
MKRCSEVSNDVPLLTNKVCWVNTLRLAYTCSIFFKPTIVKIKIMDRIV